MKQIIYFITILLSVKTFAQTGSGIGMGVSQEAIKSRSFFEKISWTDKNGAVVREMVLNNIARVDSANNRFTYLQIRNDGKIDSSVAELKGLRPIFASSISKRQKIMLSYMPSQVMQYMEEAGKVVFDSVVRTNRTYLDAFLFEYTLSLGSFPENANYTVALFRSDKKTVEDVKVKYLYTDAVSNGKEVTANAVVQVDWGTLQSYYFVDQRTHTVIKSVTKLPDGSFFIKELI